MDGRLIVVVSVLFSTVLGLTLVISGSLFHLQISAAHHLVKSQCYHAANPSPNVENVCLHFLVWKTSAMLGVIFGILHVIFGLATMIVTYIYQIREAPPWERRNVLDDYIAHDCQIIWLGYHLLTMLLFSYIFYVLVNTKADTWVQEELRDLQVTAIAFICLTALEMIVLGLGILLVIGLGLYLVSDFVGFRVCVMRQHGAVYTY